MSAVDFLLPKKWCHLGIIKSHFQKYILEIVFPLLQMKQSKLQPIVDLDAGVYLRTGGIRSFTLLDHPTHSFPRYPLGYIPRSWVSFPTERSPHEGRAEHHASWCCAAAHSHQFWVLVAKVPGYSLAFISAQQPDLQDLPPLLGSFLQAGPTIASFQDYFLFLRTLLFHTCSSFQNPSPWFPNLNSPCAEAQYVISLPIGDSCQLADWGHATSVASRCYACLPSTHTGSS